MALVIELLGPPKLARHGEDLPPPRGRKSWGLLAYLLLAPRPPARDRLAELLFPDADDPLGALRWSLSELRRLLGRDSTIGGDPVVVELPPGTVVDVEILSRGRWSEALDLPGLGRELLEGVGVAGSGAYEIWLANERRHLRGAAEAVLHEAALACLGSADAKSALGHASRLVELNALDEANHLLFVQCLRAAGDHEEAVRHVGRCTELFRRELDVDPSPALLDAARVPAPPPSGSGRSSVIAKLEAGEAAVGAGALHQGLQTLREAAALARQGDDRQLLAQVLVAVGDALVHAARGGDEEGAAALHEAAALALELGDPLLAATARRDLAFVDLFRGRYDRVRELVDGASRLAAGNDAELAWIGLIDGACLSDQGHHAQAFAVLGSAVDRADRAGAAEASAMARSLRGRLHVLRGELGEARAVLERSPAEARSCWVAFSPWPEALLAEVELRTGEVAAAEARFEHAFAMGRELDDPCWESIAARGLGLAAMARGDAARGFELLADAPRMCRRLPDSYVWIEAYGLDALCTAGIEHGAAAAPRWVLELEALASRSGMRELLARAMLHRARLGDAGALDAARELVATIDNPALEEDLSRASA